MPWIYLAKSGNRLVSEAVGEILRLAVRTEILERENCDDEMPVRVDGRRHDDAGEEAITKARDGLNVRRLRCSIAKGTAKLAHRGINPKVGLDVDVGAPQAVNNLFARHQSARLCEK